MLNLRCDALDLLEVLLLGHFQLRLGELQVAFVVALIFGLGLKIVLPHLADLGDDSGDFELQLVEEALHLPEKQLLLRAAEAVQAALGQNEFLHSVAVEQVLARQSYRLPRPDRLHKIVLHENNVCCQRDAVLWLRLRTRLRFRTHL